MNQILTNMAKTLNTFIKPIQNSHRPALYNRGSQTPLYPFLKNNHFHTPYYTSYYSLGSKACGLGRIMACRKPPKIFAYPKLLLCNIVLKIN